MCPYNLHYFFHLLTLPIISRELLGLSTQLQLPASDLQRLQELVLRHERVVLLLDSAVQETRLAREAMLLYIQVRCVL